MVNFGKEDIAYYDINDDTSIGKSALKTLKLNKKQLKKVSFPFQDPKLLKSSTLFELAKTMDIDLIPSLCVKTKTNLYVIYYPSKATSKLIEQEYNEKRSIRTMLILEELNNIKCSDDFGEWNMIVNTKKLLERVNCELEDISIDNIVEELIEEDYCEEDEAREILNQIISKLPEEDFRIDDDTIIDIIQDEQNVYIAFPSNELIEFTMSEIDDEEQILRNIKDTVIEALGGKTMSEKGSLNIGFILDNTYDSETMRLLDLNDIKWIKGVRT